MLKGHCNVIAVPVFNPDTAYFSNIIDSTSRDLHAFVIQANTAEFGDSRITAPYKTDYKNIIKIKGGDNEHVVIEKIELSNLLKYQYNYNDYLQNEILNAKNNSSGDKNKKAQKVKPLPARYKRN